MQSQQRAEAGVREIVVGYVGRNYTPEPEDIDMQSVMELGPAYEIGFNELPADIKDIVAAENHRMQTGEVLSVESFKKKKREGVS
jgi:hypothetical protein